MGAVNERERLVSKAKRHNAASERLWNLAQECKPVFRPWYRKRAVYKAKLAAGYQARVRELDAEIEAAVDLATRD